jgi:IS30 family transposase
MWSKKELIDKQAEFWAVLSGGVTLQAACDAVGVNRRTGRRWRQATGGRIPRTSAPPSGRYLSLDGHLQMADPRLAGATVHAIATELDRSPSTVNRELRRNGPTTGARAGNNGRKRRRNEPSCGRRSKASKFDNPELASVVQAKLCPRGSTVRRTTKIPDMVMISERPGEVADRPCQDIGNGI